MIRKFALLLCLGLGACASARVVPDKVVVIPAGRERAYDVYHYAPAVRVGDMVIVSGIPAGRGDSYAEKVRNLFADLQTTLAAAGATMDDIVELQSFHSQVSDTAAFRREFELLFPVHGEFFKHHYPAWTAVGTTALLADGAPLELRAVAVIGSGRHAREERQQVRGTRP